MSLESQLKLVRAARPGLVSEKALAIFPGALGDFICFLPALKRLARGGEVDLFARSEYADLLPPRVRVRSQDCYEIRRLFIPGAEADAGLKRFFSGYSLICSWSGAGDGDFVRRLKILSGGKAKVFPFRPARARIHAVDYFLSCLGVEPPTEEAPEVFVGADAVAWCRSFWQESGLEGRRVLLFSPGSGAKEKNWPPAFYAAVAEWWQRRFDGEAVLLLGPVEEERGDAGISWGRVCTARGLQLGRVAALIRNGDTYLGNDSGITHMAAALGVPTVALFGPTDPARWAPRGKRVAIVSRRVECSPCPASAMKSCGHHACLTTLDPHFVTERLEEVAGERAAAATFLTRADAGIKVEENR